MPESGSATAELGRHVSTSRAQRHTTPKASLRNVIDFYGHAKGEILVVTDLCTREAMLWFVPNRKQQNVARALPTGLIFQNGQKGAPPTNLPQRQSSRARRRNSGRHEFIPQHTTSDDRGTQSPLKRCCRALHAAPDCLPNKVRRQPTQKHAGLSSANRVFPQHRVQLLNQLHALRGWNTGSELEQSRKRAPAPGCK
jgi:hypothetical protein